MLVGTNFFTLGNDLGTIVPKHWIGISIYKWVHQFSLLPRGYFTVMGCKITFILSILQSCFLKCRERLINSVHQSTARLMAFITFSGLSPRDCALLDLLVSVISATEAHIVICACHPNVPNSTLREGRRSSCFPTGLRTSQYGICDHWTHLAFLLLIMSVKPAYLSWCVQAV